jgi:hypothetical protein
LRTHPKRFKDLIGNFERIKNERSLGICNWFLTLITLSFAENTATHLSILNRKKRKIIWLLARMNAAIEFIDKIMCIVT